MDFFSSLNMKAFPFFFTSKRFNLTLPSSSQREQWPSPCLFFFFPTLYLSTLWALLAFTPCLLFGYTSQVGTICDCFSSPLFGANTHADLHHSACCNGSCWQMPQNRFLLIFEAICPIDQNAPVVLPLSPRQISASTCPSNMNSAKAGTPLHLGRHLPRMRRFV